MIALYRCDGCGHAVFPARQCCRSCGGAEWSAAPCDAGVIEAATTLQHRQADPVHLAAVRTAGNVRLIVRLATAGVAGADVRLREEPDGALWGDHRC